jgi:hypothetical protein
MRQVCGRQQAAVKPILKNGQTMRLLEVLGFFLLLGILAVPNYQHAAAVGQTPHVPYAYGQVAASVVKNCPGRQ